ncbi:probable E3 ubiquitin-protein ligase RHY1A [Phragmites australis]|uniref:probable E3 ubiquitin-protein ligase RHY1A n=1 Tax=Phragmites australis TaxID=29695 RepID=UPI002D77518F|nr:probable E3 ubiquitin-protein ligase RHY1A [Phragmites australis]
MLPGVELARRRRVHYHGDVAAVGEHHHHGHQHHAAAVGGMAGPALAARIRLEEKLRGATPPSPSRWGRLMRDGRATSRHQNHQEHQQQQQGQEILATRSELWPPPNSVTLETASTSRAELRRTLSMVDVCAVCLDEVRERHQRVTRLPCSHKYHSECVLPWLAIQPDCPCCRTLVPSVDTLS